MKQGRERATAATVQRLIEPALERLGYELVLVEYGREPMGMVLRLFVDKTGEGGITLDDCARVSQDVSATLAVEDPIEGAYHLEVSSPGLNRPLTREKDFVRYAGEKVKVVTHEAIEGRRSFSGVLGGLEGDLVLVTVDGKPWRIPRSAIARANIEYQF
jgi:ribosome maturation factor RimP